MRNRDDSLSTAAALVRERVRESSTFLAALSRVTADAGQVVVDNATVEQLKALGGISAVVKTAIERAVAADPALSENLGSAIFPMTPADLLRQYVGELRTEVQLYAVKHRRTP